MPDRTLSVTRARAGLVVAAVLWSSGSAFTRILREPTALALHEPGLSPLQMAFFRGLFGGLALALLVRRADVKFHPLMVGMVAIFAVMSGLYLSALALGPAANAIFLQNTSPFWVYLLTVFVLGQPGDRRGWQAVTLGLLGAVVIVAGNWPRNLPPTEQQAQVAILGMGVGSGIVYAGVVIFLRVLRDYSPAWLVMLNLLGSALALALFVLLKDGPSACWDWLTTPTVRQLAVLAVFGVVQMATPYWLFARGLRAVGPVEAGIITLLEPLLNPLWAFLITPEKDTPTPAMYAGGGLIFAALVMRYIPDRRMPKPG